MLASVAQAVSRVDRPGVGGRGADVSESIDGSHRERVGAVGQRGGRERAGAGAVGGAVQLHWKLTVLSLSEKPSEGWALLLGLDGLVSMVGAAMASCSLSRCSWWRSSGCWRRRSRTARCATRLRARGSWLGVQVEKPPASSWHSKVTPVSPSPKLKLALLLVSLAGGVLVSDGAGGGVVSTVQV